MKKIMSAVIIVLFCSISSLAGTIRVSSIAELTSAISAAVAGDTIIVADGVYTTSSSIGIIKAGTPSKPILITAESIGGVEIKGSGGFQINSPSAYIIIKGFKFTHSTGSTRISSGATFCIITRNIFECAPAGTGNKAYLSVSGDDNEISFNTFQNKNTEGCMITVQGPGGTEMAKRTWIHHNYFYNFISSGFNNSSAIQLGLSGRSLSSAYSIVEYNLFIKTAGENEGIICNKSGNNIFRYNTFGEGSREVSLRHGNFCEVYNNFFINSDGLRFCGDDHKIYNNYFSGCKYAINCVNGDGIVPPDGTDLLTSHDRPDRVKIYNNTLINNTTNYGMPNRTDSQGNSVGFGAIEITFANNVIQGGAPISISTPYTNPTWEGNIIWATTDGTAGNIPESGYTFVDPQFERDSFGFYRIKSTSPAINSSVGSYPGVTVDIDGQPRIGVPDAGADEYSDAAIIYRPLTLEDVGPFQGSGISLPAAPGNLIATAISNRRIDLTWADNSDNEERFRIDRSTDGGVTWSFLANVTANEASYSNVSLNGNTTYHYQVRAENYFGGSEYSNIASATTLEGGENNLAMNKPVTYSSQQMETGNENPATNAVDGNTDTRWSASIYPQWIEVDLGSVMVINKTELVCYSDRAYQYAVDVRTNSDGEYKRVVNRTSNTTPGTVALPITNIFDTTSARYVKLTVTGCYGSTTTWASISEFRVFYSNDPVSVEKDVSQEIPSGFELFQNYPNPFNPSTVISYQISTSSHVQLIVYDMLGKEVAKLVDEEKQPGFYKINFNGQSNTDNKQLTSGIYFAQLTGGQFIKTIKLLLIK